MALPAGTTYRQYLQNRQAYGSDSTIKSQAQALLQVVGDDGNINGNFVADPYKYSGRDDGQVYGYGPDGMTRINSNMYSFYKDPNAQWQDPHVQGLSITDNGSYSGAVGTSSTYDPNAEAAKLQIDQGIEQNQNALNRIDPQLNTAIGNIGTQYNSAYNKLLGDQAVTKRNYDSGVVNQNQDYLNARENVASNSRNLLTGARRLLGSQGAGGGSADRYAAPNAAQLEGANQNAVVQQTNARNLGALATSNEDNERKYKSGFEDLDYQKGTSERGIRSQFEQQRAGILEAIAQLTGQKTIANGGNYQAALAASRPYTDRVSGILNTIDGLAANPGVIKANEITLNRPDLANYTYDRFTAPSMTSAPRQDSSLMSPALAALLGYDQQDRQQQLV